MKLTLRILVLVMIFAAGLGAGVALGKVDFRADTGRQETIVAAAEDDSYLPARYTYPVEMQMFGEFAL